MADIHMDFYAENDNNERFDDNAKLILWGLV